MRRLWLDANVVLRFLTGQPPDLAQRARAVFARAERGEVQLALTPLVIAEVVWVLRSYFRKPADEIAGVLIPLILAEGIHVEHPEIEVRALELAAEHRVDYVDAHLALWAAARGDAVCTFDEADFKRLPCRWSVPEPDVGAG